ncbi:MAG TPA: MarR family transcriptional regulator [Bryobacteraceae bacterium]|nr:MarR family transcriptional regulator [Bryobacteraceae bacterium]
MKTTPSRDLSLAAYRSLAEFRHQIRRFLRYSEDAARASGIEPQQHQLLLAIKGLPIGELPTVGELAGRIQLRHHTTVELINRMTDRGMVLREPGVEDKREVLIRLTEEGERILHALSVEHQTELKKTGPELRDALDAALMLAK